MPWRILMSAAVAACVCGCVLCVPLQDVAPPLDEISRFNAAGQADADDMNVS
jgi:hypothetical protein